MTLKTIRFCYSDVYAHTIEYIKKSEVNRNSVNFIITLGLSKKTTETIQPTMEEKFNHSLAMDARYDELKQQLEPA